MTFRDEASERRGPLAPIEVALAPQSTSQLYADLGGSIVGVFATTFLVLPRDVRVRLVISFANGKSITATGAVQFLRTAEEDQLPGLGISFTEIAEEDLAVLRQFSERVRPPMFYDE